jgi:nucleoside-diphosphate-sugar epimerase
VQAGRAVDVTKCEQVRDFLYIRDAAEAVWRAVAQSGEKGALRTFNVGTGQGVTLRRFIDLIARRLRERGLTPDIRFGARPYRPGEAMTVVADVSRLKKEFGWLPSTPLESGVARAVDSMLVNAD